MTKVTNGSRRDNRDTPLSEEELRRVMLDVMDELRSAERKFPAWATSLTGQFWNLSIITEEVGECARVLNDHANAFRPAFRPTYSFLGELSTNRLRSELLQVAAMAIRMAANL